MRLTVVLSVALLLLGTLTSGARAQEYVIWQNPLDLFPATDDVHVELGSLMPGAVLTFDAAGSRLVLLPLALPNDVVIRGVTFCYRTSDSQTKILQFRIIGMTTPEFNFGRYDETTDLDSTVPVCFESTNPTSPPDYVPDESLTLEIVVNIWNAADVIELGAIGIRVEPAGAAAPWRGKGP